MRAFIAVGAVAVTFAVIGYASRADMVGRQDSDPASYAYAEVSSGSDNQRSERAMKLKEGTKRKLGRLRMSDGADLDLFTATTVDGQECLIEEHSRSGVGAGCVEGGLFRRSKVEFSVNTDGGPDRFSSLYVAGLVAPSVGSASLVLTDGTLVRLALTTERTFLYESAQDALGRRTYPTGFRLFGPNGKLVESVTFPPAGE